MRTAIHLNSIWPLACIVALTIGCGENAARHSVNDDNVAATSRNLSGTSSLPAVHSAQGWEIRPVLVFIDENTSEHVELALSQAAETWNQALGEEILVMAGRAPSPEQSYLFSSLDDDMVMVITTPKWMEYTSKPSTTLATTVWENDSTNHDIIIAGDIIINETTYVFADTATDNVFLEEGEMRYPIDAESVLLHELGHLLGLDHTTVENDPNSVMLARTPIGPGRSQRNPSSLDIELLRSLYRN